MSTLPPSPASPAIAPATLPHLWRARWSWGYAAATLGLTIILVWTVANLTDLRALAATLGALLLRTDLMAIFLVSYTGAFALRAIAWRTLLAQPVPTSRLFVILQIALLANHLFPTKVGEVIRIGLLTRAGAPVAAATASTLMARLLDFGALCGIALCLTPLATGNASNVATRTGDPALLHHRLYYWAAAPEHWSRGRSTDPAATAAGRVWPRATVFAEEQSRRGGLSPRWRSCCRAGYWKRA